MGAIGGAATAASSGTLWEVLGPGAERVGGHLLEVVDAEIAAGNERRARRAVHALVKVADGVDGELTQRFFRAQRHVCIWVRPIHDLHEGPIGDRRGHVANLHQAGEPQLLDPIEVRRVQPRADHTVGKQRQRLRRELRERGDAENGGVGGDVRFEMRAEAGKRGVDVDCRKIAGTFIHHVGGNRRQPFIALEIGGRADGHHEHERHDGQRPVFGRPEAQPVRKRVLVDPGESKRRRRPDSREPRSIRSPLAAHDTTAGVECGSANDSFPLGTTLSAIRLSVRRYFLTAP